MKYKFYSLPSKQLNLSIRGWNLSNTAKFKQNEQENFLLQILQISYFKRPYEEQ